MNIAFSSDSSWNRWHPTYDELGQLCKKYNVKYLELVFYPENDKFYQSPEILKNYDVDICCINATAKWRPMLEDDPTESQKKLCECIELANNCNARYVIHYPGYNTSFNLKETLDQYKKRLDPCLNLASKYNIILLLENHFDLRNEDPNKMDPVRNPDLTALFLEALNLSNVKVNYDPGNVYCAGIEPWPYAYQILKEYIVYVHLKDMGFYAHSIYGSSKDIETLSDSHSGTYVPIALGEGGINYFSMLNDLKSNSKIEYFTFEDHARPEIRDEVLSKGVNFIKNIINK